MNFDAAAAILGMVGFIFIVNLFWGFYREPLARLGDRDFALKELAALFAMVLCYWVVGAWSWYFMDRFFETLGVGFFGAMLCGIVLFCAVGTAMLSPLAAIISIGLLFIELPQAAGELLRILLRRMVFRPSTSAT